MAEVSLSNVGKVYADGTRAVTGLSIDVSDGEFLVLVGPSGCGKSTALRMIAGLEDISEGTVRIGDKVVNRVPSRDRDVAMVFQSYALYPHLTVFQNIAFSLQYRNVGKAEIARRVAEVAAILDIEPLLERKPRQLSGGQRQRVAMGRAIVREPQAFLMDEPLSNLDAKLRVQMRAEIGYLQNDLGVTTIYVTHDQTEAMTLGDRVAVMKAGVLHQIAPPQELYDRPVNLFVASFIGSPAMNLVHGALLESEGKLMVRFGVDELSIDPGVFKERPALKSYVGRDLIVGIRPEDLEDARLIEHPEGHVFTSKTTLVEPMGSDVMAHFPIAARVASSEHLDEIAQETGARTTDSESTTIVARLNPRTTVTLGQELPVHVDTSRLHYFAPDTGAAIWQD